jgi:hypothetical protein
MFVRSLRLYSQTTLGSVAVAQAVQSYGSFRDRAISTTVRRRQLETISRTLHPGAAKHTGQHQKTGVAW